MTYQHTLKQIAHQHLGLATLTTRRADALDFHDHAVWAIEAALQAAFDAGRQAAVGSKTDQMEDRVDKQGGVA